MLFLPPQTESSRAWARSLVNDVKGIQVAVAETPEEAFDHIADADAAFGTVPVDLLRRAKALRWLQAPQAAPPAGYFYGELVDHPVVVTNFRGIYNDHVANHAMALTLALARGLHRYFPQQLEHRWQPHADVSAIVHLPEATTLIVGVGGVGTTLGRCLHAFGTRVIGVDPRATGVEGIQVHHPSDLDRLLPEADIIILTVPHTPETEGMINAERLGLVKPTAVLINVGRGMTVNLEDLRRALVTGGLAGAALDVFEAEPLPSDHPLWDTPNVILTPHVAHVGPYLDGRRYDVLADNARRFSSGEELCNVVDKRRWY